MLLNYDYFTPIMKGKVEKIDSDEDNSGFYVEKKNTQSLKGEIR